MMKISIILRSANRFPSPLSRFSSSLHTPKIQFALDEARSIFLYMLQTQPRPHIDHYHRLLTIIIKMEQYPLAVFFFKKMLFMDFPVNNYFMSSMVHSYSQMNRVDLGFAVVATYLKRGISPNIVTYNSLIRGLFLKGDVGEAVALFKNSIPNKLEFGEFTISIVLGGLCKAGEIDAACQLLGLAEKNNWKLNVFCYNSMLNGFVKSRMMGDAIKLVDRMVDRDISPGIVTYNTLLHGLCEHNMLNLACTIFSDLSSRGVDPSLITCNIMIRALAQGGRFQAAKDILQNMKKLGLVADSITYNTIVYACILHCDDYRSVDLLKQIVGMEFELDESTSLKLSRNISEIRQMTGIYDDDTVMHLMQKLVSSDSMHKAV